MTPTPAIRRLGAVLLVLSPLLYAASGVAWPRGSEGSNSQVVRLAALHPGAWYAAGMFEGLAALAGLIGVTVLALVVTGRGAVLARVALGLSLGQVVGSLATWVLGAVTVNLAANLPHDRALSAYDALIKGGYLLPFVVLIFAGVLSSVLVLIAAVRARLVPWWVLVIGLVGLVGSLAGSAYLVRALPALVLMVANALIARGMLQPISTGRVASTTQPLHDPA